MPPRKKPTRSCRNGSEGPLRSSFFLSVWSVNSAEQITNATMPTRHSAQPLCHDCFFFSREVDSGGAETEETRPKWGRGSKIWPPLFGVPPEKNNATAKKTTLHSSKTALGPSAFAVAAFFPAPGGSFAEQACGATVSAWRAFQFLRHHRRFLRSRPQCHQTNN